MLYAPYGQGFLSVVYYDRLENKQHMVHSRHSVNIFELTKVIGLVLERVLCSNAHLPLVSHTHQHLLSYHMYVCEGYKGINDSYIWFVTLLSHFFIRNAVFSEVFLTVLLDFSGAD